MLKLTKSDDSLVSLKSSKVQRRTACRGRRNETLSGVRFIEREEKATMYSVTILIPAVNVLLVFVQQLFQYSKMTVVCLRQREREREREKVREVK